MKIKSDKELLSHMISMDDVNVSKDELAELAPSISLIKRKIEAFRKGLHSEPAFIKSARQKLNQLESAVDVVLPTNIRGAINDLIKSFSASELAASHFFRNKNIDQLSEQELIELYKDLKTLDKMKKGK